MKKLFATGLLFTFFFIKSVSLFALPQDLYGTWIGEYEDDAILSIELQFDESTIKMVIKYILDNEILEQEEFTTEIAGWEETANTDNKTKSDYPDRHLLKITSPSGTAFLELYISGDKKQLIMPELNGETGEIIIFARQ
jgi:hypothetical protein